MTQYTLPESVKIFEVGARDGLQNEPGLVTIEDKVELIGLLSETGLSAIEAGSFVSPKWVPQMASSGEVFKRIARKPNVKYSALTPNMEGFEAAIAAGVNEIAVFGAASESFSQKNINCSIEHSIVRFEPVIAESLKLNIPVRAYISCVVDCPYEGSIEPQAVARVAKRLFDLGCYEVSLGDTIGTATPLKIQTMIESVIDHVPAKKLAIHCHDTYGQAIANIVAALQCGVATVDSSVAGLGGCPYANGASGNVASEDVLYLLNGLGIATGVDLHKLIKAGDFISNQLGRKNQSKVAYAYLSKND
ncbi:MAG: hydroxymethylglutaryl-CoA lyase [Arenicella sp.]|jgi:hydroxymethylglutaryl-CoA lyase